MKLRPLFFGRLTRNLPAKSFYSGPSAIPLALSFGLAVAGVSTQSVRAANITLFATDVSGTSSFTSPVTGAAGGWGSSGTAATSGNTYQVTTGLTLRGPASNTSVTFAGDSLTLDSGSTFLMKNNGTNGAGILTINNNVNNPGGLILNGGTVQQSNTANSGAVGTLAGTITTTASTTSILYATTNETLKINSTITGSGNLTMSGGGSTSKVIFNAANTGYTGTTTISAGAVRLDNADALAGSTVSVGIANGLTFGTGIGTFNVGGLSGSGSASNFVLADTGSSAVTLSVGANNANTSYSGVMSGIGAVTKTGSGTLILSGTNANTFSGGLTLLSGVVQIGNSSASAGGVLTGGSGGTGTLKLGSGTNAATFSSTNTVARTISTNVSLDGDLTLGNTTGNLIFDVTGTTLAGGALTTPNTIALTRTNQLTVSTTTTFQGAVTGSGFGFTKLGSSQLSLGAGEAIANTYSGLTTVSGGSLALNKAAGTNAIAGNVQVDTAGTLSLTASNQISDSSTVTVNSGGLFSLGSQTETIGSLTVGSGFSGNAVTGGGTLIIAGAGTATINSGNVTVTNLTTGSGGLTLGDGAGVSSIITHSGNITYNGTTIGATLSAVNTLNGNRTFSVANGAAANDLLVSAAINDGTVVGSNLIKDGLGTMVITATAGYTGTTSVNSGTLQLGNNTSAGGLVTSGVTVASGATVAYNRTGITNVNYTNGITGAGKVTVDGAGALFSTANSYTGGLTINAGVVQANNNNSVSANDNSNTATIGSGASDAEIQITNSLVSSLRGNIIVAGGGGKRSLTSTASGTTATNSAATVTLNNNLNVAATNAGGTFTIQGVVSGTSGLIVDTTNAGNVRLLGANTYTGPTTINAGTLSAQVASVAGVSGALGLNSTVTLANTAGATLALNFNTQIGSLGGGGTTGGNVNLNALTLTTGGGDKSGSYAGAISGTGGLTKTGTGIQTLTFTNSYSGATAINGGTLRISGGSAINNAGAVTLANTAGVIFDVTASETIGSLAGGGTTGGTVALNSVQLISGDSTDTTFGGVITGTGSSSLVKKGTGTMTLTGANTYSGDTYVVGGTLAFSGGGNVNNSIIRLGETTGTDAATLSITDTAGGNSVNSTIVVRSGSSGTKTLSATNTSGTSTFGGSVYLDANVTTNSATSGGTLAFTGAEFDLKAQQLTATGSGNTSISGVVKNSTGTGKIVKQGAGTLILSGANTYGGNTEIDAGTIRVDATPGNATSNYFVGNGGTPGTAATLLLGGAGGTGGGVTLANAITINPGSGGNRTLGGTNTSGTNTFSNSINFVGPDSSGQDRSITLTAAAGGTVSFAGALTGGGFGVGQNVTKTGAGTVKLASNSNSYFGATQINEGILNVMGTLPGGSAVTVGGTGSTGTPTLAGNGTIAGATTIAAAGGGVVGVHSVGDRDATTGNSQVGQQTFSQGLTYADGSIFEWQLGSTPKDSNTEGSARGTDWDAVNVAGTLTGADGADANSTFDAVFKVVLNGSQSFADSFWDADREWTDIFKTGDAGTAVSFASIFSGFSYANGSGSLSNPTGVEGSFTITGSKLSWSAFTAVPEPSSALAGLLVGAGLLRRRRVA